VLLQEHGCSLHGLVRVSCRPRRKGVSRLCVYAVIVHYIRGFAVKNCLVMYLYLRRYAQSSRPDAARTQGNARTQSSADVSISRAGCHVPASRSNDLHQRKSDDVNSRPSGWCICRRVCGRVCGVCVDLLIHRQGVAQLGLPSCPRSAGWVPSRSPPGVRLGKVQSFGVGLLGQNPGHTTRGPGRGLIGATV